MELRQKTSEAKRKRIFYRVGYCYWIIVENKNDVNPDENCKDKKNQKLNS